MRNRKPLQQIDESCANTILSDTFEEFQPGDLDYYAWPKLYGSTAGPFSGIGGQAMTTFTLEAWTDGYYAVVFCGLKVIKVVSGFNVEMRV